MDIIIPAKGTSTRVPNKNWREFHDGKGLAEIMVGHVLDAGFSPERVHLSCEDESKAGPVCERTGINFLPRDPELCDNGVPLTEWILGITRQVPGADEIAWVQVCDPLFNAKAIRRAMEAWDGARRACDSLVVCYPWKGYLLTDHMQPIGWSFGEHHTPSQHLPQFYTMPFTMSILTRGAIKSTRYHVGRRPHWHVHDGPSIDIDTEEDFEVARIRYQLRKESTAALS